MSRFVRFLMVGVFNTAFGYLIIFAAMYLAHWPPLTSNAVGYAVGLVVSFVLNRSFTFRSSGTISREMKRFVITFALAYAANAATLLFLIDVIGLHAGWSQILAGAVYVLIAYWISTRWVFVAGARSETPRAS